MKYRQAPRRFMWGNEAAGQRVRDVDQPDHYQREALKMANENVPHGGKVLSSVYKAMAGGDPMPTVDLLTNKLAQLQAMLLMTYGEAQDPFDTLAASIRDNYMWACSTLVDECIALVASPEIVSGVAA